jgi:hypothetical protein
VAIDVLAGEIQFTHHLARVYDALADPGDFIYAGSEALQRPTGPGDTTRPVLVASYGDHKRARHMGYQRIARIEHGAGQSYGTGHGNYSGGKDCEDIGLFLVPNQYSADLWQNRYPDMRVEIVGSPKLDMLPRKDVSEPVTVAISFHFDTPLVPETLSGFGHFRSALEPLSKALNLIGHAHPRATIRPPYLDRRYRRAGIEFVPDFAEVCRRADVYICDNSSTLYEFAATGRPVVVMSPPWYRRDVQHGLRFWDAIPGIEVTSPQGLLGAVQTALDDPPSLRAQRERAVSIAYTHRTGAAQRAAQALSAWENQ